MLWCSGVEAVIAAQENNWSLFGDHVQVSKYCTGFTLLVTNLPDKKSLPDNFLESYFSESISGGGPGVRILSHLPNGNALLLCPNLRGKYQYL